MPSAAEKNSAVVRRGLDPKLYQTTSTGRSSSWPCNKAEDGSISPRLGIGPTALATLGLLRSGRSVADPQVAKGLKYPRRVRAGERRHPHARRTHPGLRNLHRHDVLQGSQPRRALQQDLKDADAFIRKGQIDETKGKEKSDVSYGGIGYGGRSRPDLSNTAFLVDALKSCGGEGRRSGPAKGPGVRLALPEPGKRAQHHEVRRKGERRRVLLHARARQGGRGPRNRRRRPAQLRLDDLFAA